MTTDTATPARLLEAGRQVFAENGLSGARTRDICALAQANVAAVNYHFGSKEQLYIRVLYNHILRMRELYPLDAGVTPDSPPAERLRAFIRGLLQQLLAHNDNESAHLGKMILLEMVQPSQHVDILLKDLIRPTNERLRSLVAEMMPGVPTSAVSRCAAGIMSQFSLFRFDQRVLDTLGPGFMPKEDQLLQVADAMTEFSLGGIERLRARYASE